MATMIKVGGQDLKLAYTLHTAVSYEKMTGKNALDLSQFQDGNIASVIDLGYCMLASANKESEMPKYEEFLKEFDTFEKVNEFIQAVTEELVAFFKPTAAEKSGEQGDDAKNG